jgi:hypothetical protein
VSAAADCTFCHGRPVINAGHWIDSEAPKFAPCPRCGHTFTEGEFQAGALRDPEPSNEVPS